MNIYKISQKDDWDFEVYLEAIVVAKNEDEARLIHPNGNAVWDGNKWKSPQASWATSPNDSWCPPDEVKVELVENNTEGVISSSFRNA